MADETPSKLSALSEAYRTCSLIKNSCGYVEGNEYKDGNKDVISDGDCRGRDPKDSSTSSTIGTNFDIECRNALLGKNANHYTVAKPYGCGNC